MDIDLYSKPMIVLIGVETKLFEYLDEYIGSKYILFPIDNKESVEQLDCNYNIQLFMIDTDKPWIGVMQIVEQLKSDETFQNVPIVGLSLKQHFPEMLEKDKHKFEDFILMPCGNEDLLTRIEVWTKTFEIVCADEKPVKKTYSIDEIRS